MPVHAACQHPANTACQAPPAWITPEMNPRTRRRPAVARRHDHPRRDDDAASTGSTLWVVGIGSSAGGIEALGRLLAGLSPGLGAAYVVAQHLSPTYNSLLPQVLAKESPLPVVTITTGMPIRSDHVHVTPPGHDVIMRGEALWLREQPNPAVPKPSVDALLASIAEHHPERGIAIILSGTGSDGATGTRAVKAAGGFTIAQQPESARHDGMPRAAIASGCVDWILPPGEIGTRIAALVSASPHPDAPADAVGMARLTTLLTRVQQRTQLDLSGYKLTTLWRRLERRMRATRSRTLEDYLGFIESQPEELEQFARDILISVTAFFRDREAFQALERALTERLRTKPAGEDVRVWVPGCATGEEAFTVAIVLDRICTSENQRRRVQIFATDVDCDAMQSARRGRYSAAQLAGLGTTLTQRYFRPAGDGYEIIKRLRETVIFARHDLMLDPPFLKLDLISCRNLLIYLTQEAQQRVLSLFHYALLQDGLLLLGRSEGIPPSGPAFVSLDKRQRLFVRRGATATPLLPARTTAGDSAGTPSGEDAQHPRRPPRRLVDRVSQLFLPDAVAVDAAFRIQHVFGQAGRLLALPSGAPTLNLLEQLPATWRPLVLALLRRARREGRPCESAAPGEIAGAPPWRRIRVRPLESPPDAALYLVTLERIDPASDPTPAPAQATAAQATPLGAEAADREVAALTAALDAARREVRAHLAELESAHAESETLNQEMQALNQEMQATNEELQAANEELESANEALQAGNEALQATNEAMQAKSEALRTSHADLSAILDNVGMPMLIFDDQGRLTRFNPAAAQCLALHARQLGSDIEALALPPSLAPLLAELIRRQAEPTACERVVTLGQRAYILHAQQVSSGGAIVTLLDQTERLASERALRESNGRLEAVMQHSPIMVAIKDIAGRYQYVNPPFCALLGVAPEQLLGSTGEGLWPGEHLRLQRAHELEVLRSGGVLDTQEDIAASAGRRRLQVIRFALLDETRSAHAVCIQMLDITARSEAEAKLRLTASVIDAAAEAVMVTDAAQNIVSVNNAFTRITGYTQAEIVGHTPNVLRSGLHDVAFYKDMWAALATQDMWQGELENLRKDGSHFTQWTTISTIRDQHGNITNYVSIFSDISDMLASRRRMEQLALHDMLTGLPNRALLLDRLRHALARAARNRERVALMFIDLDNFKDVNDSLGHDAGDLLLRQMAVRLQACIRTQDTLARLGGDEFTILIENSAQSEAELVAMRIQAALGQAFNLHDNTVFSSASVGIAFYPDDGDTEQSLMQSADTAMYLAKRRGRNTFCYSTIELRQHSVERLALQSGLRKAPASGELEIVYQPLFSARTRQMVSCEALMRWHHPQRGPLPPTQFIPIAEESGLIISLTNWLLDVVCAQIAAWRAAGLSPPRVAVNVSPLHFRLHSLADSIADRLESHGLTPSAIGIEITESTMSGATESAEQLLRQLKQMGLHISLDDFGTGYSSLSRLSRLPIDAVKIDRAFVAGLDGEHPGENREITRTIILMAHSLGMTAVAEGVERPSQLERLLQMGCDTFQGFLLGKPLSAANIARFQKSTEPGGQSGS